MARLYAKRAALVLLAVLAPVARSASLFEGLVQTITGTGQAVVNTAGGNLLSPTVSVSGGATNLLTGGLGALTPAISTIINPQTINKAVEAVRV
jgi:hypothetical protein